MTPPRPTLTPESARLALQEACRSVDLDCEKAPLIRMGENAMFRLPSDVMARIGRSEEASHKEVRVASWFESERFPAARLAKHVRNPISANGFSVTFWEFIREDDEPIRTADLGVILRKLHALTPPANLDLPKFEPVPKVAARLDRAEGIPKSDVSYLRDRAHNLEQQFFDLNFTLPPGPIHGDAHNGNLMRDERGRIRLIDFEDFAWGPREWDVAVAAVRYKSFDWLNKDSYAEYVKAYGFDPISWDGFPVLRAIRELNMATWLMQRFGESAEIDAEILRRIADLRNEEFPRGWIVY